MSDDGRHGLTLIAFIGSVFSPYYAAARRRGAGDPTNHCAMNIALYGPHGKRWAMTERGQRALQRTADTLRIGRSTMSWDGTALAIEVDEIGSPFPARVRGKVRLYPDAVVDHAVMLDEKGMHRWRPIAPCARVEVTMEQPALSWSGRGYFDANDGDAPLEAAFSGWHWSRAGTRGGTTVLYDVVRRHAAAFGFGLHFDPGGGIEAIAPPPAAALPNTRWGIARATHADAGHPPIVRRTLEDTPFYARSLIGTCLHGEAATAMHESLSLDRFRARWVQALLPFRMPRRRG